MYLCDVVCWLVAVVAVVVYCVLCGVTCGCRVCACGVDSCLYVFFMSGE